MTNHDSEAPQTDSEGHGAPVYHSRWMTCDDCECSTVIERMDSGVPDENEWEEFGRCLVCGSSQLHWNADEDTVADRYWRMGRASVTRPAESA